MMARRSRGTTLDEPPRGELTRRERHSRKARRARARAERACRREESRNAPSARRSAELSSRRARRRATRRRRRALAVLAVVTVVALGVILGGELGGSRTRGPRPAPSPAPSAGAPTPAAAPTGPSTLLLVHRGADGRADVLALAGATRDRQGRVRSGSILLLAPDTQAEVPSLDLQTLADVVALARPALVSTTVENLLAVRIDRTVVLDDAGLAAALGPAAPLPVHLDKDVKLAGGGGVIASRGSRSVDPGAALRILMVAEPGSELGHLPTVQAVLEGWLQRLRDPEVASATNALHPELSVLTAIARTDVRVDALSVDSLSTGGTERFAPRRADIARSMKDAFPQALLATGRRPRVEILNGVGTPELAPRIAAVVVPAGGEVIQTGNLPGFGVKTTQIVYYRDRDRDAAEHLVAALGCGKLARAQEPIDVVDVTILLGADCVPSG